MSKTTVVHCKYPGYDVYVGRFPLPSTCPPTQMDAPYGNKFNIPRHEQNNEVKRAEVIRLHEEWLLEDKQRALVTQVKQVLKGKILGCWCAPKRCHGDTLARVAEETEEETEKRRKELAAEKELAKFLNEEWDWENEI